MSTSEKCGTSSPVSAFIKIVDESERVLLAMSSCVGNPIANTPNKNIINTYPTENPSTSTQTLKSINFPLTNKNMFFRNTTYPFFNQKSFGNENTQYSNTIRSQSTSIPTI